VRFLFPALVLALLASAGARVPLTAADSPRTTGSPFLHV